MKAKIDYTTGARRFAIEHPILSHAFTQAGFWLAAYTLLAIIIHLASKNMALSMSIAIETSIWPTILVGTITGFLYGFALGLLDYFFDRQFFRNKPLGKIIVIKSLISLVLLVFIFNFLRFVLYKAILAPSFNKYSPTMNEAVWINLFVIILIYSFVMTFVITFIIQVNKKYGPGILIPLLLGKYREPKEEERIFMFMDLKSSTAIAEELGHIKYSKFIRDSFMDINLMLNSYDAEIYQYVGDEIVISWKVTDKMDNKCCVQFFFACQAQFNSRRDHYLKNYGVVPLFKAGLHLGKVTAVEIGEVKRDIAYHGDTLNTAARIQSMCNEYDKKILASSSFINSANWAGLFTTEELGTILLKGKKMPVRILSIEQT
ncbi:adenylate/guanylate cyclase domain-containing protein [Pedobacter namyangjuensis]|uniref:adenylate/guanylate cyclase domain-containing protein n=1 Tax=Pedobacter namyangjuensis TaxID=600626 RepID=UPI000DE4B980|nr:adenylate/guanylate cyclase domain-containing protein [Pedobacter namyangjuensis]